MKTINILTILVHSIKFEKWKSGTFSTHFTFL